ncbi:MAG TPA: PH domain-containing protein [Ferruginibacter sp.]|nr:PH domain-containing protein [Ferruginibacter sp.]
MSICAICDAKLGFLNKPTFGVGKLSDGNEVCLDCFKKINKKDAKIGMNLKKYTTEQTTEIIKGVVTEISQNTKKLDEIKEKIKALGMNSTSAFLGRKEINKLPEIMTDGEEFENILQGVYNEKEGILVATNKRLLFIDVGLIYGSRVEDFSYTNISSVLYETGIVFGKIIIMASGNRAIIDKIVKSQVKQFADHVRNKLSNSVAPISTTIIHNAPIDVADQILKLATLKQQGLLTEEEFQGQKMKLLGL